MCGTNPSPPSVGPWRESTSGETSQPALRDLKEMLNLPSWLSVRRPERAQRVLSQEGMRTGAGVQTFVLIVQAQQPWALSCTSTEYQRPWILERRQEMEKNNFPKGKGADEGMERSRITTALNQVLRTASDEDSLVTRKGQKGHQFHAVVSIPLIFP